MKTKYLLTTVLAFTGVAIFSLVTGFQPKKPWVVPDKYEKMKNTVAANAESLKNGKELWARNCQSCHGKTGHGDGSKAAQLKTEPGNFSLIGVQNESDRQLWYTLYEGRAALPSFNKKIPDEDDIWSLVNYIRTLDK